MNRDELEPHVAKGYEVIPYERIASVEQHRGGAGNRRKRAS